MIKRRAAQKTAAVNPFETRELDTNALMASLASIDSRDLRCKFKNTQDPITLAFESIEETPLKTLAQDFVKESITDFISVVKAFCR